MLYINIDRKSPMSLIKQIYYSLRNDILNGTLKAQEKLPSTRELSKELNVSRNVVVESYEQLIAEGYIYTKNGSGTYVCDGIYFERKVNDEYVQKDSKRENVLDSDVISFRTGTPDLKAIPIKKWGQIYKNAALSLSPIDMGYHDSDGEYKLRFELANYLRRVRGVNAVAENIIITNGAAQAFSLLCQLVSENEYALVENPMSYGIFNTLKNKKVNIRPIPVDEEGIVTSYLENLNKPPKLIFTTPSHQFPTGVIMTVKRRIELIEYARKQNAFIIEDDYDSEFRFAKSPIQSMQALDPEHVIYVGTFSKTFMPSLRMGYMIIPDKLCSSMKNAKYIDDIHSPALEQLAMAEFIKEGLMDLHIKRMKNIYLKKRNALIKCLKETFSNNVSITGADAGIHLMASFKDVRFTEEVMGQIMNNHIEISPASKFYIDDSENGHEYDVDGRNTYGDGWDKYDDVRNKYGDGRDKYDDVRNKYENALVFGYGNVDIESIEAGIRKLYEVITLKKDI